MNVVNNCIVLVPVKTLHKEPKYKFLSIEMKLGTFLEPIRMVGNSPSILKCLKHVYDLFHLHTYFLQSARGLVFGQEQ